ncbi:MAG: hypothetical protein HKM07_01060, partial [Chlamydiae bacterium]|nr:hypothetical protein [Chlamydiota bacterium]
MKKLLIKVYFSIVLLTFSLSAKEFPDLGGILDLTYPERVSNHIFVLTNPKSGSHLLINSIMKIAKNPVRIRLPLWYYLHDPSCYNPYNIMDCELDFLKPTIYWHHDDLPELIPLNGNSNKLIFTSRNYKENIISNIILTHKLDLAKGDGSKIEMLFSTEIFHQGVIFTNYMRRLQIFDNWDERYRCLIKFEDLTNHPANFVPELMSFIGDDSNYE